ncbi:hypothetical protein B0H13DRAFT_2407768 [Mycena leptocephala]|nr:hypothetical protein B0H13DRAFT_2407768 [Mycena leptocephala]
MAKKHTKVKEMFKPYDAEAVPDSMPFPELALVTTTKGEETAVPKLNQHQRSWILDVALRRIDLASLVTKKDAREFYDQVKSDAFDAKAFQHTEQPGDRAEEACLPALVATWKQQNPTGNQKNKKNTKTKSGGDDGEASEEEQEQEDEGGRVGLLRGYTKAGWRWAIQKVISNKRTAEKHRKPTKDTKDTKSIPVAPAVALSKLFGISASTGRDQFRLERHDEIQEHSKTLSGPVNAGGKFRKAEAELWAREDHALWEDAADDEEVNWKERQMLVAGGFQHMVEAVHATGKFRPLVATVVTAWVDEHGKLQLDWVEAIPEGIRVRQPFEKQYAKLTSDYINAMYAWAEKPLQAARDASTRPAPPIFPVTAEALDDMSPNMVAHTVTSFLVKSYHTVFGSEDIPWAAIASAPDEYYDTVKFDLAFGSKGLEELKSTQWHALATTLASSAGEGTSGFFRKASPVGGEEEEHGCGTEEAEEARLKREAEEARLKREEEARSKREVEEAGLRREEEAGLKREEAARLKREEEARSKREAEEARLKREEEARLKREEAARLKREEAARSKREAEEARLKREEEARSKREAEERAHGSGQEEQGEVPRPKPGERKRKPDDQLVPEDAGEEAKAEREKKLAATVGAGKKVKPRTQVSAELKFCVLPTNLSSEGT